MHLEPPFAPLMPAITQTFANIHERQPLGYLYPDGTVGYHLAEAAKANHFHNGVDYGLNCGTPLYAPADGRVIMAGHDETGFGLCLMLDHGPVVTLFAHQSQVTVSAGMDVKAGELVSYSGGGTGDWRDGNSNGCHLHFSCIDIETGRYRNPEVYFTFGKAPLERSGEETESGLGVVEGQNGRLWTSAHGWEE